jgi:phosphoesterase RecJ-like protein
VNDNLREVVKRLSDANRVILLTHRSPDGDAAGSVAALCAALRHTGRSAYVLDTAEWTELYAPFVAPYTLDPAEAVFNDALIVAVDTASANRLMQEAGPVKDRIDIAIDHHHIHTPFAQLLYNIPDAAACGEVVYDIVQAMGIPLAPDIARPLFLALSGDTACFRYASTTARTLRIAAELMDAGADAAGINKILYETKSHARIRLERAILDGLTFYYNEAVAVCCLSLAQQKEIGAGESAYENISAIPRGIEGVKIALIIREVEGESGECKVSARGTVDVAAVCAAVGGGGHKAAAGAVAGGKADEVRDRLLSIIEELYGGTL